MVYFRYVIDSAASDCSSVADVLHCYMLAVLS
jgi:hypothetical protein